MLTEVLTTPKQLAQNRPGNTSTNVAIKKAQKSKLVVTSIIICNTTSASATYSIYLDRDGSTYDATSALFMGVLLAANSTDVIEFYDGLPFDADKAGNLAVQSNTTNALTFTINGYEY